jgi:hypothetical protein
MQCRIFRTTLFLAFLLCLLGSQSVFAKKMYRWVDEHGDTYFSDQVPPEQVKHSRASLSKTGKILEVTEKAKTKWPTGTGKTVGGTPERTGKTYCSSKNS